MTHHTGMTADDMFGTASQFDMVQASPWAQRGIGPSVDVAETARRIVSHARGEQRRVIQLMEALQAAINAEMRRDVAQAARRAGL